MSTVLYKTCGTNGDYSNIFTAMSDMLVSGVAATGSILEYYLDVLDGLYSGHFTGSIPYSGTFNIISSGAYIKQNGTNLVSGNFSVDNLHFYYNNYSGYIFTVPSYSTHKYSNIYVNCYNGCSLSPRGTVYFSNSHLIGLGSGYLSGLGIVDNSGTLYLSETDVSNFNIGVISGPGTEIKYSNIYNNNLGVTVTHNAMVSNSLINNNTYGIYVTNNLNLMNSTINGAYAIRLLSGVYEIQNSILYGSIYTISGVCSPTISSYIENSNLFPNNWVAHTPYYTNITNSDPKFFNPNIGDCRLKINEINGSPSITGGLNNFDSDITINVTENQFLVYDNNQLPIDQFSKFIFKQGSNILFSDFNQEVEFATIRANYGNRTLNYSQLCNIQFTESDIQTLEEFNPWDWDYKVFNTTKIDVEENFIVPKSRINIKNIIDNKLSLDYDVLVSKITKDSVKVFNEIDYRGLTYDFDLTKPGESIVWVLEGKNQILIKRNFLTGDIIDQYPILSIASDSKQFIRPSGLVYIGVDKDRYMFVSESDPNKEYLGYNENGDFRFLDIRIDKNYDVRGILSYKDRLYITCTNYDSPLTTYETFNTDLTGVGKILMYDNNVTFEHYISKTNTENGPKELLLSLENMYPTDLTIYEDGSLLVADYKVANQIFKYKFAYDYALKQTSVDKEARILLRENYEDVYV